jgi:hypothetical protein
VTGERHFFQRHGRKTKIFSIHRRIAASQRLIPTGHTIWIVDAHCENGKRFVVRADEKLTAFMELERAICIHLLSEQILDK